MEFPQSVLEITDKVADMSDVVQRLRASKRNSDSQEFEEGYGLGQEWAESSAEVVELQRLKDFCDDLGRQPGYDLDCFLSSDAEGNDAFSVCERIYFAMHPEDDHERESANMFWECAVGDDDIAANHVANPSFLRGFINGALDAWQDVEGKL